MAYVLDRETRQYWKGYGQGLTPDISKACAFSNVVAVALAKLFAEKCFAVTCDEHGKSATEIHHAWKPRNSPPRSQHMIDNNLVWVVFEDSYFAVDRQSLALGTILALRGSTPHADSDEAPRSA